MFDRGLNLTLRAVRRQIAAMPHDLYLIRLIHNQTKRAFPGERLWTAAQLTHPATLRFLHVRNREGCDVYMQPYAENCNPGYILVDLDHADPQLIETHAGRWLGALPGAPDQPRQSSGVDAHQRHTLITTRARLDSNFETPLPRRLFVLFSAGLVLDGPTFLTPNSECG